MDQLQNRGISAIAAIPGAAHKPTGASAAQQGRVDPSIGLTSISEFKCHTSESVRGLYRVISRQTDWSDQFCGSRCKVRLGDFSGEASVLVAPSLVAEAEKLHEGDIIWATIKPRLLSQLPGGTMTAVEVVTADGVANIARVIPQSRCPTAAHASLTTLVALLDRIEHVEVSRLISVTFNECYKSFARAQGGWEYHHAFPGGLLVHTTNVARQTEHQAALIYSADRSRVDVLVAGALFHDLGKAVQIVRGPKHPIRSAIPHEILTLQILSGPLEKFGDAWPGGGRLLAEILVWLAQPPIARQKGHDAELIHYADILDVKADRAPRRDDSLKGGESERFSAASI